MFFETIKLKRNHWSYKLLQFAFPSLNRFYNFCPHFWMTILAIILLPFVLIIQLFKIAGTALYNSIQGMNEKAEISQMQSFYDEYMSLSEEDKKYAWYAYDYHIDGLKDQLESCEYKRLNSLQKKLRIFRMRIGQFYSKGLVVQFYSRGLIVDLERIHTEFDTRKEILHKFGKKEKPKTSKTEKTPIAQRPWWPKMILVSKILAFLMLFPIGIGIGVVGYSLIMFLGWILYWIVFAWTDILITLAFIIGGVTTLILVVYCLSKISDYLKTQPFSKVNCEVCQAILSVIKFPFKVVWWGFKLLYKFLGLILEMIGDAVHFLIIGFQTLKADNCPEIEWIDD